MITVFYKVTFFKSDDFSYRENAAWRCVHKDIYAAMWFDDFSDDCASITLMVRAATKREALSYVFGQLEDGIFENVRPSDVINLDTGLSFYDDIIPYALL